MELFSELAEKVENGQHKEVMTLVEKGIAENISVSEMLNKGLVAGMNSIGIKFRNNEVFVPEVLMAARAMKAGLAILKPVLLREKVASKGKIVLGTVKGDLHDIGKNIVCYMLQGAGFDVIDVGIDVPKETFIDAAKAEGAQIIALSSLLTTTMVYMQEVMNALHASDLNDTVKVIVGGAPVTQAYANEIGAHGYAADASTAVDVVRGLLGR
jgi:5-methyltetrahydrofolate--homocysteine methyltransferase